MAALSAVVVCTSGHAVAQQQQAPPWVTAAAQPMTTVHGATVRDETCRQVMRSTAAGTIVRFRLSNLTSVTPIRISRLTAAIRATGAATGPTTDVPIKGKPHLTLLPGAEVVTDAVVLPVHAGDDVAVSFAVRGPARLSAHLIGAATGWCTGRGTGDHTAATVSSAFRHASRYGLVVESLEVQAPGPARGVVAIGDSLTDAPLSPDTYQRWTDVAAARTGRPVANAAIAGNRVVLAGGWGPTVLQRFRRDVIDRPGAHTVVVFAGTNDIPGGISPSALTARLQELCNQARRPACGSCWSPCRRRGAARPLRKPSASR